MTVSELREKLEGLPDDLRVAVCLEGEFHWAHTDVCIASRNADRKPIMVSLGAGRYDDRPLDLFAKTRDVFFAEV